jgi:hypothetical protein
LQENARLKQPGVFQQVIEQLPAARKLKEIQNLIDTVRSADVRQAIIDSVKDPGISTETITITSTIAAIKKSQYAIDEIQRLRDQGLIDIQTAEAALNQAKIEYQQLKSLYQPMAGVERPTNYSKTTAE